MTEFLAQNKLESLLQTVKNLTKNNIINYTNELLELHSVLYYRVFKRFTFHLTEIV
jgi:hypothetical protein